MKIVISPAKALDYNSELPTDKHTHPCFLSEATRLNKILRGKSPKKLTQLMGISEKLADLNWQRNQDFTPPFTPANARPAVYAFNGDVYTGLEAYTIPKEKLDHLQEMLRILSGLYGVLKPLDLIQPYRLEMGTKLPVGRNKNLYEFWKRKITKQLNEELREDELFINLASQEYFSAIDVKALKVPVITIKFKDFKNGQYKSIMLFAKKARGLMVRYIIDTQVQTLDDIKGFNYEGYAFSETHSVNKNELIFIR